MSVPVRRRRLTAASPGPAGLATFLRHLEASGSVSFAAARAGIARNTVYQRRKVDPDFAAGWERAVALAVEALRDVAVARAHDGDDHLLMFLLRTLKPEVFGRGARTHFQTGPAFRPPSKRIVGSRRAGVSAFSGQTNSGQAVSEKAVAQGPPPAHMANGADNF